MYKNLKTAYFGVEYYNTSTPENKLEELHKILKTFSLQK